MVTRMGQPVACRSQGASPGAANRCLGLLEGRIRIAEDLDVRPEDFARDFGMLD